MASSAEEPHRQRHHLSTPYATTAAPPPTPSTLPNLNSSATTADALSTLLHRLPPTLSLSISLPTRRSSTPAPLISLSDPTATLRQNLLSASTKLGFFHLSHHLISATPADSAGLYLFSLPHHQKQLFFPNTWPLGYNDDDDYGESFCIDSSCFAESRNDLELGSLHEFTREMESLGQEVIQDLASAIGFENPTRDELCSQLWISDNGLNKPGRIYPYVVGLHYITRYQKCTLWSDSGRVNVSGQEDSVLVTLGDIAQVWSNGKFKKVRGRPMPCLEDDNNNSRCITMSLLITLPIDSTVYPLIPNLADNGTEEQENDEENGHCIDASAEQKMFHSFPFEEYAWRVYHERLLLKDPLVRHRI